MLSHGNMLELATEQLIGSVRISVQHSAREEMISGQFEEINDLLDFSWTSERYLFRDGTRFWNSLAMS